LPRAETTSEQSLADLQGPAGNTYDKYGTRNPAARVLVRRFLAAVDAAVAELAPASLLDVGCGEGVVTERLARALPDATVVGVDVAAPRITAQWERRSLPNLSFRTGSAYDLPFGDSEFEVVTAFEVFEHLEQPDDALAELSRVASWGLVLSVPWEPAWRASNILSGRYVRRLGNTPGHVNHWTRRGFRRFLAEAGPIASLRRPYPWTVAVVLLDG
jgi:trans-aconitate methyltransferase